MKDQEDSEPLTSASAAPALSSSPGASSPLLARGAPVFVARPAALLSTVAASPAASAAHADLKQAKKGSEHKAPRRQTLCTTHWFVRFIFRLARRVFFFGFRARGYLQKNRGDSCQFPDHRPLPSTRQTLLHNLRPIFRRQSPFWRRPFEVGPASPTFSRPRDDHDLGPETARAWPKTQSISEIKINATLYTILYYTLLQKNRRTFSFFTSKSSSDGSLLLSSSLSSSESTGFFLG